MLPITTSLGLNIYEVENIGQFKKYLLVEGEADIYTMGLAYHISKIKKSQNIFIIPTTGKDNKYVSKIIKNILNSDFMCLYDGKISIKLKTKISRLKFTKIIAKLIYINILNKEFKKNRGVWVIKRNGKFYRV